MVNKHILIIEDQSSIADTIDYALKTEGYTCSWANTGIQGIEMLTNTVVDLVILDIGLPDMSGFEVCKLIRKKSDLPIIFLSARNDEMDKVVALEIGGDDYIVKPHSARELLARVKTILKRQTTNNVASIDNKTKFIINEHKRVIEFCNSPLDLTNYEYGILKELLSSPGRAFSRDQLMSAVWASPDESYDRSVDTHIKTIRAKIHAISPKDNSLITHRGIGYSIKVD
ncbi:two-component system response regulator CreB [Pseudoalteromonas sp. NBT06-2]|uniref:two-component system response regulator CreB n=1 Tax=Pseudoalteromonas sp. NBT06-2 TaxID=2025950 RepID=UPI000BA52EF5|nr:two-component system response regulator CreB [Pseudoalteromonas sp. NBT06-2]PAJ71931.1 two-component system response regulator CreB [Pseudoalteromonas sp. NBT06-2]